MIVLRNKEFSEIEERTKLKDIQSHRGLGRSYVLGGEVGAIGGYVGKRAANKADEKGKSDAEIMNAAKSAATKTGGALGAVGSLTVGSLAAKRLKTAGINGGKVGAVAAGITALGTVGGALSSRLGAKKNTEVRLQKRSIADN